MIASLLPTWDDRIAAILYLCVAPTVVWGLLAWASKHTHDRHDRKEH